MHTDSDKGGRGETLLSQVKQEATRNSTPTLGRDFGSGSNEAGLGPQVWAKME